MAILKNLIVNGSSRFLNTTYFQDVSIAGSANFDTISASGDITAGGNLKSTTGNLYLKNLLAINGQTDSWLRINANNAFSAGTYFGNNIVRTDGTFQVGANGAAVNIYYANNNTNKAMTVGIPATFNDALVATSTANLATVNATNVNVTNNLRANHYDLQTVAQLGGSFYVSPTVKFPNSGTTLAVAKSGTTLTLTITDSSITSTTMAGIVWSANSRVKVSGTINGVVTGTMDGTISSINTGSHTLTLSVSGENSGSVVAGTYSASQFSDLSVMVYQRRDGSNDYRVGIWMNCYDIANSSSTIRIYGGSDTNPNVMLGNLTSAGLGTVNNLTPTGWGLFAQNAFLHGKVVANGGFIGNWNIGQTGMYYNSDAPSSTSITMIPGGTTASTTSIGGSSGSKSWIFTGKNLFGIDTTGKLYASSAVISGDITANTGYIGGASGWTIAAQQLSSGTLGADDSLYLGTKNLGSNTSIGGRSGSDWRLTVGSKFGVTNTGALYASSVDLTGKITATSGTIGGCTIDNGVLKIAEANISGTLSANVIDASELSVGRTQYKTGIKTSSTIVAGHIICGTSSGYVNIGQGVSFDLSYPLLYAASTVSSGSTTQNVYLQYDDVVPTINGTVSGGNFYGQTLFLKGTVSGKTFTISSNPYLTTNIPNNYVSDYYIPLGTYSGSSSTKIQFISSNQLYAYINGTFQPVDMATRRYITDISSGGIKVSYASSPTNYLQITADGTSIYKNSVQVANYGDSIIIGKLAADTTHVEIDSDSFDVCFGATTGANSTKLATFGEESVIGNMSARGVSINSDGFKFNNGGKTAFYIGIDNRSGSTASEATGYTFPSNPEIKYINSIPYYLLTTISSDRTVIEVGIYAEMEDPEAESRIFFDWVVDDNKLYINCDEVDQKYDTAIDYVSYIYTTNTNTQASYCMIGDNAYSSSNPAGTMSFAQGYKCLALGAYSTSVGWETLASGTSSFSLGKRSEAQGAYSFAGGALSTSKDFVSFAYGYKSNAWGKYSVAFGNQDLDTWIFEILITSCDTEYGDITCRITQNAEIFEDYISAGSILVSTDNQYIFEDLVVTSGSGTSDITFSCSLYGGHFPAVNSVLHVRVNPPGSYGNGAMSVNACCASGISSTALGIGTTAYTGGSLAIGMYNIPESNVLFSIGNGTMLENHNAMTVDMFGNAKATKFIGDQKILWQGKSYMSDTQKADLSELVSAQANGIVLVWSGYTPSTSTAQNYQWHFDFIPKWLVAVHPGAGVTCIMAGATFNPVAAKYVYIDDDKIRGFTNNASTSGTSHGISWNNTSFVLRYVIGV